MEIRIKCVKCNKKTKHKYMHNSPYGIAGAHMSGTERYECQECDNAIFSYDGKKKGLEFFYDE